MTVLWRRCAGLEVVEERLLGAEDLHRPRWKSSKPGTSVGFNTKSSSEQGADKGRDRRQVFLGQPAKGVFHAVKATVGLCGVFSPFHQRPPFFVRGEFSGNLNAHGFSKGSGVLTPCHGADIGGTVAHRGHGEEQAGPLDKTRFHREVARTKFIAASHQMFEAPVGVVGRCLHAFHRKTESGCVGHRLLFARGRGPVGVGKLRVAMDTKHRFGETLLEFLSLTNRLTCSDLTKTLDHGMLGHMTVPLEGINDVAVLVDDGCGSPIVPQPHGWPLKRFILTLALRIGPHDIGRMKQIIAINLI